MSETKRTNRKADSQSDQGTQEAAERGRVTRPEQAGPQAAPGLFYAAPPLVGLGGPVQAKVAIGAPDDAYEREADAVAQRVVAGQPAPPISTIAPGSFAGLAQRQTEEDEPVQMMAEEEETAVQAQFVQRQEEEEEPVQMMAEEGEETAVQAQFVQRQNEGEEEEPIQRETSEEEEPVQTEAVTPVPASVGAMQQTAAQAIGGKGAGAPLQPATRQQLEGSMGADLSGVRVHQDSAAQEAAAGLNARAFTHGQDIWLGRGESPNDLGLIAHEATHVVQQAGSVQRRMVQRAGNERGLPVVGGNEYVDLTANPPKIKVGALALPPFKAAKSGYSSHVNNADEPLFRAARYARGNPNQSQKWDTSVNTGTIADKLRSAPFNMQPGHTYMLRAPNLDAKFDRIGGPEQIAAGMKRPFWNSQGQFEEHHVDHMVELQISGWPRKRWANELPNMEMLNASANTSSGSQIDNGVDASIESFLADTAKSALIPAADRRKDRIKQNYDVVFQDTGNTLTEPPAVSAWTKSEVERGDHVNALTQPGSNILLHDLQNPTPAAGSPYSPHTLSMEGIIGSQTSFRIYYREYGGESFALAWNTEATERGKVGSDQRIYGFQYNTIGFDRNGQNAYGPENVGFLRGPFFRIQKDSGYLQTPDETTWDIKRVPGTQYAGYLDRRALSIVRSLAFPKLSPIEIDDVYVDSEKGLVAAGRILPTVPILGDLQLELLLEGDDIRVQRVFDTGDFQLPGPIQVTGSSLTLSVGTQSGLVLSGRADFTVERLGQGFIEGAADARGEFKLAGGFDFDSTLFDPARVRISYENGEFRGQGELGIPRNKVRGVRSATITVNIEGERWSAVGTVEPDMRGVQSGTLTVRNDPERGWEIGGELQLSNELPGIRGGTLTAVIAPREEGEGYKVRATGDVPLDIPGMDASIHAEYDDGAFLASGTVGYERGMLRGSVTLGVTNRPVGEDGRPAGEPTEQLTAYGGGSVTIRIAPWLQGTVGIRLLPNGEIEVTGEIALPSTLELFPEKRVQKNIFTIGVDIPIVGVAVAGQRIGIFANISGGLDASASIGPGQLQNVRLGVTYNPDREAETRVTGDAAFVIPAQAGLRLFVRGSLGAGIPIVSASAGLEIGGQLGLQGEARADAHVEWTPTQGLALDATGRIFVEPRFTFDITGFVLVEADLLLTTIELYSKRWRLVSFEYGSGMRFGVIFPVRYREGEPFDISLSDVQFEYPDIDTTAMLRGLISRIA